MEAGAKVEVAIWLQMEDLRQEELKRLEEKPEEPPREVMAFRERMDQELSRFAKELEGKMNAGEPRTDPLAPVVCAQVTPDQIREIKERPEVPGIFLHETDGIDDLEDSIEIANSDDVHALGYDGSGVRVAVWENGPDKTDDLTATAFYDPSQSKTSEHSRNRHGIVKNKEEGCAPRGPGAAGDLRQRDLSFDRWHHEERNEHGGTGRRRMRGADPGRERDRKVLARRVPRHPPRWSEAERAGRHMVAGRGRRRGR
jgi:hypothetical protein